MSGVSSQASRKLHVAFGECHNDSIPRQPPQHGIEPVDLRDTARAHIYVLCGRGVALNQRHMVVLEAGIGGETLVRRVKKESLSPSFPHIDAPLAGTIPSVQLTPRKLTFRKGWLMS